jgi:hypothetical protein
MDLIWQLQAHFLKIIDRRFLNRFLKSFQRFAALMALVLLLVGVMVPTLMPVASSTSLTVQRDPADGAEQTFLEQFVGEWEGDGTSEGQKVRDRMVVQPALSGRFFRFSYKALVGDGYEGEGYFWYNAKLRRYQWWEFNEGKWPVREHEGQRSGNQLILEEHTPERHMRLTFTFVDQNTLSMTEGFLTGDQFKPYAVVKFQRQIKLSR